MSSPRESDQQRAPAGTDPLWLMRYRDRIQSLWTRALDDAGRRLLNVRAPPQSVGHALEDELFRAPAFARGAQRRIVIGLCGPGAVGKDTLIGYLSGRLRVRTLVFDTTRTPRLGEVDGKDYRFISAKEFAHRRRGGDYLFHRHIRAKGHFGLRTDETRIPPDGEELLIVKESPKSLPGILRSLKSGDPDTAAPLLYLIPPFPQAQILIERCRARMEGNADSQRSSIQSTVGPRQVREFTQFVDYAEGGGPALLAVNDTVVRIAARLSAALTERQ